MGFVAAVKNVLGNYVTFRGRACRSEYWFFQLFYFIVMVLGSVLDSFIFGQPSVIYAIAGLALFLPSLAVTVRRLHDTDRTGWWLLIGLVPLIGLILLIVWYCSKGASESNRFGDDPLALSM